MTNEQIILFTIMGSVLGLLVWGRIRYDLVAFSALALAVIVGVVDKDTAFSGFGHPAVIIIALVLIASRALSQSGAVDLLNHSAANHAGQPQHKTARMSRWMNRPVSQCEYCVHARHVDLPGPPS